MAKNKAGPATLDGIRGSLERARANARSVAALTDNPGCARRRVIDAAAVKPYELAERLGHPVTRGQSPFAIGTGNRFERRLKEGSGYRLLVEVLQPFVPLPLEGFRVKDLGKAKGHGVGTPWLKARTRETDVVLAAIARGDENAPHIVDHPVLEFEVGGASAFLEPDALAFRVGTRLELVEIKSYAIIDEQGDPGKLASTAGQSAVYVLALRAALSRLGLDPEIVQPSVILVAPKNFGRTPVAHKIPLRKKLMALQRVLGALPKADLLLRHLPSDFTLDVAPAGNGDGAVGSDALDRAVRQLPMLYVPECLSSCDMARYCRNQAICDDEPSRLGRAARDNLAGVPVLADALRLAEHGAQPDEVALIDVADGLRSAYQALQRARSTVPATCGLDGPKPRRRKAVTT